MRMYMLALIIGLTLILLMTGCTSKPQTFEQNPSLYTGEGNSKCPQDNKICPDGSFVSRVGPNCNFEACPSAPSDFCDYGISSRDYQSKDPSQCTNMQITCQNDWTKFSDKCGCGCESPTWARGGSYCEDSERYYTVCHVNADAPNVCGVIDPSIRLCSGKPCTQDFDNRCEACKNKDIVYSKPGKC
jgi:hypothetical protein